MTSSRPAPRASRANLREALDPIVENGGSKTVASSRMEAVSKAIMAPFSHKSTESSTKILADLAPVIMTPRMMETASRIATRPRASLGITNRPVDFVTIGRAPMRFSMSTRRITSTDLRIVEATDELLAAEIPEPTGVASDVSLLRGFKATVPSSEKSKVRRRETRNVEVPHVGLKRLGMSARGLLMEDEGDESVASEDDVVVVGRAGKGRAKGKAKVKRKGRESLGAGKAFGKEELSRQKNEIIWDKENIHVRRTLITNEIAEITNKIQALDAIRIRLEEDLLRLQEDDLELDDELEGVHERIQLETKASGTKKVAQSHIIPQSSRRRKGPTFLPSEHSELPSSVAFMTLTGHMAPIAALDFSEPYGTLVTSSQDDEEPRVWDLLTGSEIGRLSQRPRATRPKSNSTRADGWIQSSVKSLQVEDYVCLTGGGDGTVRIWDLRRVDDFDEEERLRQRELEEEHLVSINDATEDIGKGPRADAHGNGITQSDGAEDDADCGPCVRVLEGHSKAVTALYFEDNCLVTGASDKTLRQWDLTTGQCVLTMDILWAIAHPGSASYLDVSTSTDVPRAMPFHLFPASAGNFAVPTPPYADGSWDMYESFVGGVQFWGYALVSGSGDGAVRMWDMRTGQSHRTLSGHTAPVTCLQFDELHIVSGGLDKTIRIWDLRTGGIFETIKYDHPVTALQFDTRKIVTAAGDNGVKIYNRTSMQHSTLTINGHTKPVERLRYMDKYLVSGARDSTVKIWAL